MYGFATMLASRDYEDLFNFEKCNEEDFDDSIRTFTNPFQILFDIIKNDFDSTNGIGLRFKELELLKFDNDTIVKILGGNTEWNVEDVKSGGKVRKIHEQICAYSSLEIVINRVLEQSKINLKFDDFCRCISNLVSCRNVNQHLDILNRASTFDNEKDVIDRKKVWWTYGQLFDNPELRKYLPHFIASLYYALGMKEKISNNDAIKSLLKLWEEFPNYAEINEVNSITKIMDSLSGRSWGYKEQYIDLQGRLMTLINGLKTSLIVTIWGEGGVGKTELVYQALKEIDANNKFGVKFSNILPFTFKSNLQGEYDDETGETKPIERGIWSPQPEFHDVVKTLAEASGEWNDLANRVEMHSCAIDYLLNNAIIVVIDNTEVIEESQFNYQLQDFISSFVKGSNFDTKSRIIITSRVSPGDRPGAQIKMKFLNIEEMTQLAIARANWLYSNFSNDRIPDVNISFNYDGWDSLTEYVNKELSRPEKDLVGHPLFVFLCVRELMYNNPGKLQFHEVIIKLIEDYSPGSKMFNLFKYITERSIASINELMLWSKTLMDMIEMEIFSEKEIKDSIKKQNETFSSADIIERLLGLDIIRILNSEEFETYQFKSQFYAVNMKTQIESLPGYKSENKKSIKILEKYRILTTHISERPVKNFAYINLPSRFSTLDNRSIKSFNREWIEVTSKLAIAAHDLILDIGNIDSTISFMDQQKGLKEELIESLSKYLNSCSKKLCENFATNPRTNDFNDLANLLTKLERMEDERFSVTCNSIFLELSANLSRIYSTGIHPASLSLVHYLGRDLKNNGDISQFPVNIVKLINTMILKCDGLVQSKLFEILAAIDIHGEVNKLEILEHCNTICRILSKSPEHIGLLMEGNSPTFFEQMSNINDIQISNLREFDIFEITLPNSFAAGTITFTKDGTEYIILKNPSKLIKFCSITCQVIWIGLSDSSSRRIYARYISHEELTPPANEIIFNTNINNSENAVELLSKEGMFKLLKGIVKKRKTDASVLFNTTIAIKLKDSGHSFTWGEWKSKNYEKTQKTADIIKDLSDGNWRVEESLDKTLIIVDEYIDAISEISSPLRLRIRPKKKNLRRINVSKFSQNNKKSTIDDENPIDIFSKQDMFMLLKEIVTKRKTDASVLFNTTIAIKLKNEGHSFTWGQWKSKNYDQKQKTTDIIEDLSEGNWSVEITPDKTFISNGTISPSDNPGEIINPKVRSGPSYLLNQRMQRRSRQNQVRNNDSQPLDE